MSTPRKRIVILISGRGSNMAALADAASEPAYPAEIVGVISDTLDVAGLAAATARKIPTRTLVRADYQNKEEHDNAIDAALNAFNAEIVVLAGYMRLLTRSFVEKWQGRMINIHPALLPAFKGLETHRRALEAGIRIHGCTVHFVTWEMDEGPIIAQAAVPVLTTDSESTLAARVLRAEHHLFPLALQLVAEGKATMSKGKVIFATGNQIVESEGQSIASPTAVREPVDLEALARFTP